MDLNVVLSGSKAAPTAILALSDSSNSTEALPMMMMHAITAVVMSTICSVA